MPRSTSRLVRPRTAASLTPSAVAIWVNGLRPSSWRCSMIRLSRAESSSPRRFRRVLASGFESRDWPAMACESSTEAAPGRAGRCRLPPVERCQHGGESLDGLDGDRIDDELDLREAQGRVLPKARSQLGRRALDRHDRAVVVLRDAARPTAHGDQNGAGLLEGGRIAANSPAGLVDLGEDRAQALDRVVGLAVPDVPLLDE